MDSLRNFKLILKTLGDDTRLRIVNLLHRHSLNVAELCTILSSTQPNISKHLTRLRLTGMVEDRRQGRSVYYYLSKPKNQFHQDLFDCILSGLSESETLREDLNRLEELRGVLRTESGIEKGGMEK